MTDKQRAEAILDVLNGAPSHSQQIVDNIAVDHRTLQQCFTRLCFAWIKKVATDPCYYTDERNRATYVKCKAIYDTMSKDPAWDYLPFI